MAYILPVTRIEFKRGLQLESATHTPITLALRMLTFLDDESDETMFTDCADVPYHIALSDTKNFQVEGTSGERGRELLLVLMRFLHTSKNDSFQSAASIPNMTPAPLSPSAPVPPAPLARSP